MVRNMETAINNYSVRKMPLWKEVEKLSDSDKVDLITLISSSLARSIEKGEKKEDKTRKMIEKFAGSWKGDDSAEKIISVINKGRKSSSEPLQL